MSLIPDIGKTDQSIQHLIDNYDTESLGRSAREIKDLLVSTFDFQDNLCMNTCINCPEPCCSVANIWYDFRDLVFLNIAQIKAPKIQPREKSDTCTYFKSFRGCSLERIKRPFICNYHICNTQRKYLKKENSLQEITSILMKIKDLRKKLEDDFIRITS